MINKEIFQCRHCGVQFGAGTHFNSLMNHWKEFHGRSKKCPNAEEKFSNLLNHIHKNRKTESLGLKNEGLMSIIKQFSNVPLEEEKSKENELHSQNFETLLNHCKIRRKQGARILHETAQNKCNNSGSDGVPSLPRSLKTKSDIAGLQLVCKNCPMTFNNPVSAVLHHKKAHTHSEKLPTVDKNNNSVKKESNSELCKAKPDVHSTDKENEKVIQQIKIEPDVSPNSPNRPTKLARDDEEDVIVISDDEDLVKQVEEKGNSMVKSQIDYSDVEIIDLTSNETAIEDILNQREIIQQFLSRSASTETNQNNANEKDFSYVQISPSSPGKEKERTLKKSMNQGTEKRKRPRDEKQGPKRKKQKRKKSKENGKTKTGEVFEEVGPKKTEERKIEATENLNLTEKVSTNIDVPKSKSVSPWEELIWNSTKDPKFSKESATTSIGKENELKDTQCENYQPKPLRRQSARKSCPSKKANNVNMEAIRRATDEDEYEISDQWPFSAHNSDSSSEDPDCGQNVDGIWNTVMSSVSFERTFGMYKISRDNPGRFLHRKMTSDGREVNEEPLISPVQLPSEPVRKRRTARKSTRSRPTHLQGSHQILVDNAKSSECECHACGKVISTDNEDLFRHYTKECNKINM